MPAVETPPSVSEAASSAAAMGGGAKSSTDMLAGKNLSAAFDALEKKGSAPSSEPSKIPPAPAQRKTEPKPPDKAKAEPAKPNDQQQTETDTDDATKTDDAAPKADDQTAKPKDQQQAPQKVKKPSDYLREELAKVKQERDTFKAEVSKKLNVNDAPEYKSLQEKLTKLEADFAKVNDDLKFSNYERSPEFKEKFEKPFEEAYAQGRSKMKALRVTDPQTGEQRPATEKDFDMIMGLSDEQFAEVVDSMFGTGYRGQMVTLAREKVMEKLQARNQALEDAGKNLAQREKETTEFYKQLNGEVSKLWQKHIDAAAIPEKHKPWFTPAEGDAEEKAALEAGYKQVDRVATEDARNPNLTPEQREAVVARAAAMRNRSAVYPLLVKRIEKRDARIAELEAKLKEYQESEPGAGDGKGSDKEAPAAQPDTMAGVLAGLEKRATPVFH